VDGDGAGFTGEGVAPDGVQQRVAAEDQPRMARQVEQQVIFPAGQFDAPPIALHAVERWTDDQTGKTQLRLPGSILQAGAPQDGVDPRHDLTRTEGLHDVVVGAQAEATNPVVHLTTGSDHQDGDLAGTPQRATDLQTIEAGQHQVENHHIGRLLRRGGQGSSAVASHVDGEAVAQQVAAEHVHDHRLVVDDEHTPLHRCLLSASVSP